MALPATRVIISLINGSGKLSSGRCTFNGLGSRHTRQSDLFPFSSFFAASVRVLLCAFPTGANVITSSRSHLSTVSLQMA